MEKEEYFLAMLSTGPRFYNSSIPIRTTGPLRTGSMAQWQSASLKHLRPWGSTPGTIMKKVSSTKSKQDFLK